MFGTSLRAVPRTRTQRGRLPLALQDTAAHRLRTLSLRCASAPQCLRCTGLTYYLSLQANLHLLREAASHCARGSKLLASVIPAANLAANQRLAPGSHGLAQLFTVSVDQLLEGGAVEAAGWSSVSVSADLAVLIRRELGRDAYQPYNREYWGNDEPGDVEYILEAVKQ